MSKQARRGSRKKLPAVSDRSAERGKVRSTKPGQLMVETQARPDELVLSVGRGPKTRLRMSNKGQVEQIGSVKAREVTLDDGRKGFLFEGEHGESGDIKLAPSDECMSVERVHTDQSLSNILNSLSAHLDTHPEDHDEVLARTKDICRAVRRAAQALNEDEDQVIVAAWAVEVALAKNDPHRRNPAQFIRDYFSELLAEGTLRRRDVPKRLLAAYDGWKHRNPPENAGEEIPFTIRKFSPGVRLDSMTPEEAVEYVLRQRRDAKRRQRSRPIPKAR